MLAVVDALNRAIHEDEWRMPEYVRAALSALPAEPPKTEGETVEAFADKESGEVRWCVVGERLHDDLKTHWAYRRLSRPIAATVEPAP